MNFKQGYIYLVNFDPSFGHEYQKTRPALLIENNDFINKGNLITVVPISSQIQNKTLLDVLIVKDEQNRLLTDSLIKTRQISSFDKRRFIKFIGTCNKETLKEVIDNVIKYIST